MIVAALLLLLLRSPSRIRANQGEGSRMELALQCLDACSIGMKHRPYLEPPVQVLALSHHCQKRVMKEEEEGDHETDGIEWDGIGAEVRRAPPS